MTEESFRIVSMPPTKRNPSGLNLQLRDRILVVIGANGSGKTRFGAWLDSHDVNLHYRVSAHRSLNFPERVQPTDLEEAERQLLFGNRDKQYAAQLRQHNRWKNNPATALLDDFEYLVTLMISESFAVSDQYRVAMKSVTEYACPPQTKIDVVKETWEEVLPDRELVFTGSRIETRNKIDGTLYHAKEMSDGERGIFHLIGEALSAPKNGVLIVDEPELHLHRAIQARLWDAIEAARPDCTFVYITHDLGFAASRKDATKVWLREYTNDQWDWEEVPEVEGFSETMLLEVMGSRRSILFVEGDRSSLDFFIYGKMFPNYTVVPCGSCEHVIHSVNSFSQLTNLHHNDCGGVVDNDGRSISEIELLNTSGIAVLPVALIENLFLVEPILRIAADRLDFDPEEMLPKIKARVFDSLRRNAVRIASNLARNEIETSLRTFGKSGDGAEALSAAFNSLYEAVDPAAIYRRWEAEISRVIVEQDYTAALRYYKIKGLSAEVGHVFGSKYQNQMMRWLRNKHSPPLIAALRSVVSEIPRRVAKGS